MIETNDVLITSTGEGTIGKVDTWPYEDAAIADSHITICRLNPDVNLRYVVEFLRSEYGQIQMLRFVSGSTGQTELLVDHVCSLLIPMPDADTQQQIVERIDKARADGTALIDQAEDFRKESANVLAVARQEMMQSLTDAGH